MTIHQVRMTKTKDASFGFISYLCSQIKEWLSMMKKNILRKIQPFLLMSVLLVCCANGNYPVETIDTVSWHFPLPGAKVISPYGKRGGRMHSGADLKTKDKDSIYAAFEGEVVFSDKYYGYGNYIRIKHPNGLETCYSHNSKNLVKKGDYVKAGQVIALVGRTGRATTPHLHFEVRINGKTRNPANYFDLNKGILLKMYRGKVKGAR